MEIPSFLKKIMVTLLYGITLIFLGMYLFFPGVFSTVTSWAKGTFLASEFSDTTSASDALHIVLAEPATGLEPTSLHTTTRNLALQIYEPLVRTDAFFRIEPSLASFWGRLSPTVWSFTLRPGVIFHNNRSLTVSDVVASFRRAADYESSDLRNHVSGIFIVPKNDSTFEIHTERSDAMLLQKISQVLIIPSEYEKKAVFAPIGTGSYAYADMKKGESFSFERFSDYWGELPVYPRVDFLFRTDGDERAGMISSGKGDIVKDVSPGSVTRIERAGATLHVLPSLQVNFLAFNVRGVFKDVFLRKAVSLALDSVEFERFAGGYATSVSQFVSSGVFGFNPKIPVQEFAPKKAVEIVKRVSGFDLIPARLTFVSGLETAGEYIKNQLAAAGFSPDVTYVPWSDFRERVQNSDSDIFFFGWKSDFGSSSDFFESAVHSRDAGGDFGLFNAGGYANASVDSLIEKASEEFDDAKRLTLYQNLMQQIVEKDPFGVPLFESQTLYASRKNLEFQPRIDGYILARDVH